MTVCWRSRRCITCREAKTGRRRVRNAAQPAQAGGVFIHSEWQFQNSPKMMSRVQPWAIAGIDETDVEAGDTLLDWRHAAAGQGEERGLRYVHLFSKDELSGLAEKLNARIVAEFESDGKGGNLALYQVWEEINTYLHWRFQSANDREAACTHALFHLAEVIIDRAARKVQQHGDLAGGKTARGEFKHLCLAFGEFGLSSTRNGFTAGGDDDGAAHLDGGEFAGRGGFEHRQRAHAGIDSGGQLGGGEFDFELDDSRVIRQVQQAGHCGSRGLTIIEQIYYYYYDIP